jgi:D-3-phosphoglycerate dehydrogenase
MKKGKVLITEVVHPILAEQLNQAGFECIHIEKTTYSEVAQIIGDYVGLVVRSKIKIDSNLIDRAPRLRFIGRTGSGMELIDTVYAEQKGIVCLNSPEGNCDSVAEQAIGMLLGLCHHIVKSDRELRQHFWQRLDNTGTELQGKTIGIIGYGNTGTAFARRLQDFGVRCLAYDKYKTGFGAAGCVIESDMKTIFAEADVLSLHIPLTDETKHLVDKNFIHHFSKPIFFVNTSRGEVVKTIDVLEALESGKLRGAALDVFENEDLGAFSEADWQWYEALIRKNNVVLTPHTAGVSHESAYKIAAILAKKIIAAFSK